MVRSRLPLWPLMIPSTQNVFLTPFQNRKAMKQFVQRSWKSIGLSAGLVFLCHLAPAAIDGVTMPPDDGKLRIICFGAHPDDCEIQASGTGAMWAGKGHHVLFVSVTNGDIGHWREAGGPLALRRKMEVEKAHKILGIQGVILDIHDGELLPTVENR